MRPDMTNRWESTFNQAREWFLESRENPQGRRILVMGLLAVLAWAAGFALLGSGRDLHSRLTLQGDRFAALVETSAEYLSIPRSEREKTPAGNGDTLAFASAVVDRLKLRDRLTSISGSARGVSLLVEGIGAEELVSLARELDKGRLAILSAEIKALPVRGERRLSVNLLLGGQP